MKKANMMQNNQIKPIEKRYKLSTKTINELQNRTPDFGYNGLGELVFRRTYSRDNESWADVVQRVVEGCMSIRKDHFMKNSLRWNDSEWEKYASDMAHSLFSMEWLPPGRGLWMMGTDHTYNKGSMALNNCFSRETRFWTNEGIKSFLDFSDGDQVIIRGRNGWKKATIKQFGLQEIWELTIRKEYNYRVIRTTSNHRWITVSDKGVENPELSETKKLSYLSKMKQFDSAVDLTKLKFDFFSLQHFSTFNIEDSVNMRLDNNTTYLFSFLAALFSISGEVHENGELRLYGEKKDLEWVTSAFFQLGVATSDVTADKRSHFIVIDKQNLCSEFFINNEKHSNIKLPEKTSFKLWEVVSVVPTGESEIVWCVVEPDEECFTLDSGIITKNCAATDTAEDIVLSAEWTMDALMNGVGVGFTTHWRGEATKPDKEDKELFVIPDSREGWVESLIRLMCSYIHSPTYGKNKFPEFDYSIIRSRGSPIKGFGGTASGPDPLIQLHERVEGYLDAFCEKRLKCESTTWQEIQEDGKSVWKEVKINVDKEYSHTRLVADIFNAIGACVVAGNVRRCLPKNSLVHTKAGLVPIQNVQIGDEVLTMEGYEKVTNTFEQGIQKTVKIITQDGEFRCTPNHRMAVCSSIGKYEWKEASRLIKGDILLSSRKAVEGSLTVLPCKYSADLNIPDLDENIAWFLGLIHGSKGIDTSEHDIKVNMTFSSYEMAMKACKQILRFSEKLSVQFKSSPRIKDLYCVSCYYQDFCIYLFNMSVSNHSYRVPECILLAKNNIKLAYLAGLVDIRHIKSDRMLIVTSGATRSFAIDVQNTLYSCGIESRLSKRLIYLPNKPKSTIYDVLLITERSFNIFSKIKTLHTELKYSSGYAYINKFPYSFPEVSDIKSLVGSFTSDDLNVDVYDKLSGNPCEYTPVRVDEIVEDITELTYDIEVSNRHEFFCNGYLTHNSAEICLGDVDDADFMNLKNYTKNPERSHIGWMSNNSVVLRPDNDFSDFEYIPEMAKRIIDNGEPGMINLHNIQKYGRTGDASNPDSATMVNPCFAKDTLIAVADNRIFATIEELALHGKDVPVYSINEITGEVSVKLGIHPRLTGEDMELVRIHVGTRGEFIDVTLNHKFTLKNGITKSASELSPGDVLNSFEMVSRKNSPYFSFRHNGSRIPTERMIQRYEESKQNYTVEQETVWKRCENEYCYSPAFEVAKDRREVSFCSSICYDRHRKQKELQMAQVRYDRVTDSMYRQDQQESCVEYIQKQLGGSSNINYNVFDNMLSCVNHTEAKNYEITSVIKLDTKQKVYNITVEDNHTLAIITKKDKDKDKDCLSLSGIFARQCGEIPLNNFELCNLSETFPPRCEGPKEFYQALEYATFYSSTVSLLPTHRPSTNQVIAKNRRIGVSVSGVAQWASGAIKGKNWGKMSYTNMTRFLREGYNIVKNKNIELADKAGVPRSIRLTTIKPSGSISLLAGVTPGVHYPVSRYAIRRVRIGIDSPLIDPLMKAGVPCEKDVVSDNTMVFEFVIDHGDVRPCEEVSPWEQFSLIQMLQKHYSDNCVSATVYFDKEKDAFDVEKMLAMYIPNLKSVSMLPHAGHGYKQAPYEKISKEQYEERLANFSYPKYDNVKGNVPVGSKFCSGDKCER